jgi:small subunit ribosomal protein S2
MEEIALQNLLESGVHFGHQTRKWNPKMRKFIYGKKNNIYIIDLQKTKVCLENACIFVRDMAINNAEFLFVGTKSQAQEIIKESAVQLGVHYINYRWLGGILTNFSTIRLRIKRLENLEKSLESEEQKLNTKKERIILGRELEKLKRNLEGIRNLKRIPDVLYIVDIRKESIAIKEAKRLNIPVVAILDTNCNPDLVDFPIPANDDSIKSISLITNYIVNAIKEGREIAQKQAGGEEVKEKGKKEEKGEKEEEGKKIKKIEIMDQVIEDFFEEKKDANHEADDDEPAQIE